MRIQSFTSVAQFLLVFFLILQILEKYSLIAINSHANYAMYYPVVRTKWDKVVRNGTFAANRYGQSNEQSDGIPC